MAQAPDDVSKGSTWASIAAYWGISAAHLESYNGCGGSTPTPTPTTASPSPTQTSSSGLPAAPAGWTDIFYDGFTKTAPTGTFATTDGNTVVYTGDHDGSWFEYPDGWSSTYTNGAPGYLPSKVLSVDSNGLDFSVGNYTSSTYGFNNSPAGANPSPVLNAATGNQYQEYGRYTIVMRTSSNSMKDFHVVPLLWPQNDGNYEYAESDFPEFTADGGQVCAYAHFGGSGAQDSYCEPSSFDPTQWHTYTQEWGPGYREYFVDGVELGKSTDDVTTLPERLQLQVEPSGSNDGDSGHVYIRSVEIDSYNG